MNELLGRRGAEEPQAIQPTAPRPPPLATEFSTSGPLALYPGSDTACSGQDVGAGVRRATAGLAEPMDDDSKRNRMANVLAEGMTMADAPPLRPNA